MPRVARASSRVLRRLAGEDIVPLYDELPGGGSRRRSWAPEEEPVAVVVPSCTVGIFGVDSPDTLSALRSLCAKAGVGLAVPARSERLCCGMPWSSKGLTDGHATMTRQLLEALGAVDPDGLLPVITDASSCTEGVQQALADAGRPVLDATTFVAGTVLPRLHVKPLPARVAVHPTCSSQRLDRSAGLLAIANALSDDVYVPPPRGDAALSPVAAGFCTAN